MRKTSCAFPPATVAAIRHGHAEDARVEVLHAGEVETAQPEVAERELPAFDGRRPRSRAMRTLRSMAFRGARGRCGRRSIASAALRQAPAQTPQPMQRSPSTAGPSSFCAGPSAPRGHRDGADRAGPRRSVRAAAQRPSAPRQKPLGFTAGSPILADRHQLAAAAAAAVADDRSAGSARCRRSAPGRCSRAAARISSASAVATCRPKPRRTTKSAAAVQRQAVLHRRVAAVPRCSALWRQ